MSGLDELAVSRSLTGPPCGSEDTWGGGERRRGERVWVWGCVAAWCGGEYSGETASVIGVERQRWSPGGKERDLWARTRSAELFGIGGGTPTVSHLLTNALSVPCPSGSILLRPDVNC